MDPKINNTARRPQSGPHTRQGVASTRTGRAGFLLEGGTMKKGTINIGVEGNKWYLIGPDGYTTTRKQWDNSKNAEKARRREQIIENKNGQSRMIWDY